MKDYRQIISIVNIHDSHVAGFDDYPHEYKKMILDLFDNRALDEELAKKYFISKKKNELFSLLASSLLNPLDDLLEQIEENSGVCDARLSSFFVWAAKNNRVDLLSAVSYVEMLSNHPNEAAKSIKAAIVFGSLPYLDKLIDILNVIYQSNRNKSLQETGLSTAYHHAIHFSSAFGDDNVLQSILIKFGQLGLSLKRIDRDGLSILLSAIRNNQIQTVDTLLKHGANPNFHWGSTSCNLHLAIKQGNSEIVKLLLNHGAKLDEQIERGVTALHQAVKQKQWQIASMLIRDYGANPQMRDKEGKTPLDYVEDEAIKQQLLDADSRTQQALPTLHPEHVVAADPEVLVNIEIRATESARFASTGIEFFSSVSEQKPSTTSVNVLDTLKKTGQ